MTKELIIEKRKGNNISITLRETTLKKIQYNIALTLHGVTTYIDEEKPLNISLFKNGVYLGLLTAWVDKVKIYEMR